MNDDGTMNENAGEYEGMDRYECREALLEELREKKLLEATQPYTHSVGHCYRCRTVLEPYLSDQWFVKMRPLADAALKAAAAGKVRLHPDALAEGVRVLARERPRLVHLAPTLVGPPHSGLVLRRTAARSPSAAPTPTAAAIAAPRTSARTRTCSTPGSAPTSGRSASLGWPEATPLLKTYYPTSVLVTARDIIYLWVARMVTMGLEMVRRGAVRRRVHPRHDPRRAGAPHEQVARQRH